MATIHTFTRSQLRYLPSVGGQDAAAQLQTALGTEFALWDAMEGNLVHGAPAQPGHDDPLRGDLVKALSAGGSTFEKPAFLADEDAVVLLAVPLMRLGVRTAAVAPFATRPVREEEPIDGAARLLQLDPPQARAWINTQTHWPAAALPRVAALLIDKIQAERQTERLQGEVVQISDNLANTYEEICLLHAVTANLQLSSDDETLAAMVVERLLQSLPIEGALVQLLPVARKDAVTYAARTETTVSSAGDCPLDCGQFTSLIETLGLKRGSGPFIANDNVTLRDDWKFPGIQQIVVVPVCNSDRLFGWLAVFNHNALGTFGSVEASLLNSLASVLGTHVSNRDLFRQHAEFLASVVRAMSSAIDAKDPYTCGHSDRVARIAVRLGKELACDRKLLDTLYMAGLLHDIGKIGIRDDVLTKPGRLTEAEFEHIKLHPGLGYRILADIKQLADVLPAVLHHHEQWDGGGYPCALLADQIPLIARILAVADAFDAMSSDRPYRKGMPLEKVDEIFRAGAGSQWDPEVIAAYFAAQTDILELSRQERANLSLDVQQWS